MDRAVEVTHTADGITLLFDTFSGESKNLLESFKNAGAAFHAAVIEDDGFLPDDVMSVYGFFLGDYRKADSLPGKPLYFNQIQIPDYWRIEGDNSSAKVMDRTRERARIFFTEPTHRRQVKIVDWLDDAGQVRLSEHYNRYGAIFCHTVFNKKGQKALRKFFDVTGREMIVENFVTGDILVRWQDKDWIFRSKTDFIAFFIRCAGLEDTAVYFNSLSYPFFASQALAPNGFRDALFWHEPVGDEIPGNMQIILHDQGTRAKRVFVSRRESYDRLIALGAPSDKVKQLGYIYSFVRENKHRPHILVCTNSENVGHLTELASLMPQMHFHVAAITEMSSKLMSAGQYDNVSLYPNVKMSVLDSLFEKCDFYLDINHEGEIVDAVHRAFLNNMLIVGYEETMHNAYYTADTNTFKESEYADMAEALNLTLAMPHLIDEALAMQKKGKRTGLTILGYVLVIVALLIVLPVVLPPIFGYHTYLSGTDHTGNISKYGSVVYLKTIDEASYKDGNIVAIESADSSARRVDSYYVDSNDSSAKEIALRDGNGVSYKVVKGQVIAKTPFIGYLSQLCFSAVGIIVTVVIFAAGVAIMMYVNKISKEINTMVEQQTA